ncbi:MAG: hypothetical protein K6B75_02720 [Lachnospiraceae bacterium]|nr:hypothetical protein [Lachnospiraceae bacterium]
MELADFIKNGVIYFAMPLVLVLMSLADLKNKYIPVWALFALAGGLGAYGFALSGDLISLLRGILPGGIIIIISLITKGKIGWGDGATIAAIGLGFGFGFSAGVVMASLMLAAVFSVFALAVKKVGREYSFPFIPFITGGYAICLLVEKTQL